MTTASTDRVVELLDGLSRGEAGPLARAITEVENETEVGRAIVRAIHGRLGRAVMVGFTGAPGTGKSTLVNAYIGELRRQNKNIGVIAVDPSSPISGGAILGDRIRMAEHAVDPMVFIRSLAARGHLGGLSPAALRIAEVMDAAGKDIVILETVGTGQSEVEIAGLADVTVLVSAPGLGDDVQAIKAGILEIADIFAINKTDLPFADRARRQIASMLRLREGGERIPVIATTATTGAGVPELAAAIAAIGAERAGGRRADPRARIRRLVADQAARLARQLVLTLDDAELDRLCDAVRRGDIDLASAAEQILARLDPTR